MHVQNFVFLRLNYAHAVVTVDGERQWAFVAEGADGQERTVDANEARGFPLAAVGSEPAWRCNVCNKNGWSQARANQTPPRRLVPRRAA